MSKPIGLAAKQLEMRQRQTAQRDSKRPKQKPTLSKWPLETVSEMPSTGAGCFRGHGIENKNVWGHCRICVLERYRSNPAAREREKKAAMRRRRRNTAEYMIGELRRRAKQRGLEFTIKAADILPLPTHCPVLGIKLDYSGNGKGNRDYFASIDRLNSDVGYLPGNVAVISYRANRMKCNATTEEVRMLLAWMEKN